MPHRVYHVLDLYTYEQQRQCLRLVTDGQTHTNYHSGTCAPKVTYEHTHMHTALHLASTIVALNTTWWFRYKHTLCLTDVHKYTVVLNTTQWFT